MSAITPVIEMNLDHKQHRLDSRQLTWLCRKLFDVERYAPQVIDGHQLGHIEPSDQLLILLKPHQQVSADRLFEKLRWGGQVACLAEDAQTIRAVEHHMAEHGGFVMEKSVHPQPIGPLGWAIPFFSKRYTLMLARKADLFAPGEITHRVTFSVKLAPSKTHRNTYEVVKQVPSYMNVVQRLQDRFPTLDEEELHTRARKLVDKVFPIFLTREAGFLRLLQRDLPEHLRDRVPQLISANKGPDGRVRKLRMNWLRLRQQPISQLDFAKQSAELLDALHAKARVMHLDLRLDNMVISDRGVCFVDFGSAVRLDEDLTENPMLNSLFNEIMSTSQIQRTMGSMMESGQLTSRWIIEAHQKPSKAADLFYLALQINVTHQHPELGPLIDYDVDSPVTRKIRLLTRSILRPSNPSRSGMFNAHDLHRALERIEHEFVA